jgi:hypothetical protein
MSTNDNNARTQADRDAIAVQWNNYSLAWHGRMGNDPQTHVSDTLMTPRELVNTSTWYKKFK